MLKIVLSILGVVTLTLSAWALEGQVTGAALGTGQNANLLRIAELREECKVGAHDQGSASAKANSADEKHAEGYKRNGREPFPAERLGIMLRVSGL